MGIIIPSGKVDDYFVKAAEKMIRPTSSGKQSYDDNKSTWPLGEPIPKIESDIQCTGLFPCIHYRMNDVHRKVNNASCDGRNKFISW